ncbi:hypothetical protein QBC35DRAFT_505993 [Podospora australis]|uniref:Uncharacterized protein n=1 Tax=Podospora australis TaxID=1536484 RepID=A0AAN7AG09_9PEZI|nr:hypothetical protein QBC35DRAFT_505993 [Podospora australis]
MVHSAMFNFGTKKSTKTSKRTSLPSSRISGSGLLAPRSSLDLKPISETPPLQQINDCELPPAPTQRSKDDPRDPLPPSKSYKIPDVIRLPEVIQLPQSITVPDTINIQASTIKLADFLRKGESSGTGIDQSNQMAPEGTGTIRSLPELPPTPIFHHGRSNNRRGDGGSLGTGNSVKSDDERILREQRDELSYLHYTMAKMQDEHRKELAAKDAKGKEECDKLEQRLQESYAMGSRLKDECRWLRHDCETMQEKVVDLENRTAALLEESKHLKRALDQSETERRRLVENGKAESNERETSLQAMKAEFETRHQMEMARMENRRRDMEKEFAQRREKELADTETKRRDMEFQFRAQHNAILAERSREQDSFRRKLETVTAELQATKESHKDKLQKQQIDHEKDMQQRENKHRMELDRKEAYFQDSMAGLQAHHQQKLEEVTRGLREEGHRNQEGWTKIVRDLENALVEKPDDILLAAGGNVKDRYLKIKLHINTIVFNLGPIRIDESVDHTGFARRAGSQGERVLVESLFWAKIMDGFFSAHFGFGALGSGDGAAKLLNLYRNWHSLMDGEAAVSSLTEQPDFGPLYHEKCANIWRSATFQCILSATAAADKNGANYQAAVGVAKMVRDNRAKVQQEILSVLNRVSVGGLGDELEGRVAAVVREASELSLLFGAHKSLVCFGIPQRGEAVEIGAHFVSFYDEDENQGKVETVELAVSPALFIIGDGKTDLTRVFCEGKGVIVPVESN